MRVFSMVAEHYFEKWHKLDDYFKIVPRQPILPQKWEEKMALLRRVAAALDIDLDEALNVAK